jgi:ATP-dependent exoDNAse (exonuclease V) beta subunit
MKERILKIEASAGSGKTYRLTLEYLSKIFSAFDYLKKHNISEIAELPSSILAITFTNKAANEMKERIIKRLKELAFKDSIDEKFLNSLKISTGLSEKEILEYSNPILEKIITDYSDFNVKTIDSLMSSIIKVISPELNLEPNYEIMVDSSSELDSFIRLFIENYDKKGLREFFYDYKRINHPLKTFNIDDRIIENLKKFYNKLIHEEVSVKIEKKDIKRLKSELTGIYNNFRDDIFKFLIIAENNKKYINKSIVNENLIKDLENLTNSSSNVFSDFSLIDNIIKKSFFNKDKGKEILKKSSPDGIEQLFNEEYGKLKKSLALIVEDMSIIKIYYFNKLFSEFIDIWNYKNDKIFVEEFSRAIKDRLEEWDISAPPLLYLKLSDRFKNFLIDEFQDTSELQFKALSPIISETLSSEEKASLFIVGDRKQAIYRWRGGNAELINAKNIISILKKPPNEIKTETLSKNWRSDKRIVDFNNDFWNSESLLKTVEDDCQNCDSLKSAIKTNFSNSFQNSKSEKDEGFVKIRFKIFEKNGNSSELRDMKEKYIFSEILNFIRKTIEKKYGLSDIAILVRKKEQGREIMDYLLKNGISAISQESLYLSSSVLINEIISFFKFMDYPPDNLNFYTFIAGEIFGKAAIEIDKDFKISEFEKELIESDKLAYILFKEKYNKLWQALIEPFYSSSGFLPPYDIFQDITKAYKLYENFESSHPFFLSFAELVHDYEQEEINSISSFLHEWEKDNATNSPPSIEVDESGDSVNVLTIHKSKGLEFQVVIVPLFDSQGGGKNESLYLNNGILYYIKKDYTFLNSKLRYIYEKEIEKDFIDNMNLMYVAFTRAVKGLFIPAVMVKNKKESSKSKNSKKKEYDSFKTMSRIIYKHPIFEKFDEKEGLMEFSTGEIKDKEKKGGGKTEEIYKIDSKNIKTIEWQKDFLVFKKSEILKDDEKKAIDRGDTIHKLFEKIIKIEKKEDIRKIVSPLCDIKGVSEKDCKKIIDFLSLDEIFCFFNGDFQVFNEKEIVAVKNGEYDFKRIDRFLLYKDRFIIMDYKTGDMKEEHFEQVKEYIEIMKDIYVGYKYEGYLLYIDLMRTEVVK